MKMKQALAISVSAFLLAAPFMEAQAARMGGGGNIGRVAPSQSAKPSALPPKPAQPQAAPAGQTAAKPTAPTPTAAPAARSWMGPLAGLAAGLGLAALASYLGFGEELMSLMLIILAVVVVFAIFRMMAARRQASGAMGYGQPAMAKTGYGSNELGAEARPSNVAWPAPTQSSVTSSNPAVEAPSVSPQEIETFLKVAREQFTKLQSIWDSGDIHQLAEFCTPGVTRELSHQIADRKGSTNVTQVVSLNSEWLGMSVSTDDYGQPVDEVEIRFSGMIRESADGAAEDFNEIWTLHRAHGGDGGWMVAGITQVQG